MRCTTVAGFYVANIGLCDEAWSSQIPQLKAATQHQGLNFTLDNIQQKHTGSAQTFILKVASMYD